MTSVANISGMSKRLPRARLTRTPRPSLGAGPLPDDRADDRERHADPQPAEDRRQRGRDLERRQDLAAGRPERAGHLEQPGVDRPDPDHRRDRDREEHDQPADDDLARQPRPEPQGEQRGEGEDRRRLGGDDVRRDEPLDERPTGRARSRRRGRRRRRRRSPRATSTSVVQRVRRRSIAVGPRRRRTAPRPTPAAAG